VQKLKLRNYQISIIITTLVYASKAYTLLFWLKTALGLR